MRTVRRIVTVALAALPVLAVTLVWSAVPAQADSKTAFTITDSRISESSGLAADPDRNVYWTVNGPSDQAGSNLATIFALDTSGKVTGTVNFRANLVDAEALAYHDGSVYIGDIGDKDAKRQSITVYQLSQTDPNNSTVLYHAFDFAYPDGAHDADAMLINDSGRFFFVTKGKQSAIYEAPENPSRQQVNTLTKVGDAPSYVTDGTFLPDGKMALRSYVDVKIIDPGHGYTVVAQAPTPFQPQGESLTTELSGDGLVLGSAGTKPVAYTMTVPTTMAAIPSPSATPPTASAAPAQSPSPSPSTGSAAGDDTTDTGSTAPSRGGTAVALLIAAGVAVIAGASIYLRRGRQDGSR